MSAPRRTTPRRTIPCRTTPRRRTGAVCAALTVLALTGSAALTAPPAHARTQADVPASAPAAALALGLTPASASVPFTRAGAERAADGSYTLSWAAPAAPTAVTVTAHTSTDPADKGIEVGSGAGAGRLTVPAGALPAGAARWYFRLTPDSGAPLTVAERSLGFAAAKNFRDLGGYRTTDGRWVKPGLVHRSNKLSGLTDEEQRRLPALGVARDIDLRNYVERKDAPDRIPAGVAYQVADVASLEHGIRFHDPALMTLAEALALGLLGGSSDLGQSIGYPFMVNFTGADHAFHDLLTGIAGSAAQGDATVFHCSAGKDRTGWGAAVLLTLLGVPRATVEADFLASNAYTGDPKAVEVAWLRSAFDKADDLYGDFDSYVRQGLGLDDATIEGLRSALLTP
ncbi:tyrosine-protein phosphatase [Streptomyces sp. NPDC059009]|uniref:tyrosine-protein phosphatase n=1 Tax=Streptomyces sp. NPDC059009 TaxID=3346694 RepID=UPI0036C66B28